MDPKKIVITGSIGAVLIALVVVGVIIYRRQHDAAQAPPQPVTQAAPSGTAQKPSGAPPAKTGGRGTGIVVTGSVTPDYTHAPDADHDGLTDPEEALYGTNPKNADTDGDGYSDGDEVHKYGSNPKDPKSIPVGKGTPKTK